MTIASNSQPAMLELEHVSKRFGAAVALDDISVDFRRGEVHALVGQNGSGNQR